MSSALRRLGHEVGVPLRLVLLEDLALGVVADVQNVDETAQIELLGSELRHGCGDIGYAYCTKMP